MTQQTINIGKSANDRSGDPLRVAFNKVNLNFADLYTQVGTLNLATWSQPYAKTGYNAANASVTLDTVTVTWIIGGAGNHVQFTTLSSTNVTYAWSGINIIAGVTSSFNSGGTYIMNLANNPNPPWYNGSLNNIGDVQTVYIQDITNSKAYRITATATSTYSGGIPHGSILIERII